MNKNVLDTLEENIMGTMEINKLVLKISAPMIISMLVQAFYNIVDSVFVSMLNQNALAAVSLTFPIQNLMIAVSVGTGVGINATLSRSLGRKEYDVASDIAKNGVFLAIISSLVFAILGLFFSRAFLETVTDVPEIINYGVDYIQTCTVFSIGICGQLVFERTLQATGKTFYSMISQSVGAIINIIVDPILIFGLFGFPRLEVKGAAIATVLGQIIGMLVGLYFNVAKNKELDFSIKNFKPSKKIIKLIYSVGLPSILLQSVASIMIFGFNAILASFSSTAIAVFGAYFKIQSFVFMPVFGINNAMVPILSYNYGAENKERMIETIKVSIKYAVIIMLAGLVIFQVFPEKIMRIFNADESMVEIGISALRIISLSYMFAGFTIILVSSFQALGFGIRALVASITRQLVVLLPIAYLLSRTNNLNLVWYAFPISEFICLLISLIFFRDIYNKVIKLI